MKVVEIVGNEPGDELVARKKIVGRPVTDQESERVQIVIERAGKGRRDEMCSFHHESNARRRLAEPRQIRAVAKIAREKLDRLSRSAGKLRRFLEAGPLRQKLSPSLHPNAVAEVVGEEDVEARHEDVAEKIVKIPQLARVAARQDEAVVDVAVEDELIRGL